MDNELFLYNKHTILPKFKVVGFIPSVEFQKCKFLVEKLYISYPKEYDKPDIRSMLNFDWSQFLTKMKRRHGKPYYLLQAPVAVYLDGELLGDDRALNSFIKDKYSINITADFESLAQTEIIGYFQDIIDKFKRKFAYLTITIDERVVGSMLFMLYNDLVPMTCENFLSRCTTNSQTHGYTGTKVHRIAKYSWIQCGGIHLHETHMPCENYSVLHDRRGVLSMCNSKIHTNNSTQFHITLNPASWMDYRYVAFGQLIQGSEILDLIEQVSTYYESPTSKIEIIKCGEFSLCPAADEEYVQALNPPYETLFSEEVQGDDVDSVLSETEHKIGKYCLKTDLKSYLPFSRYSKMFEAYIKEADEEGECDDPKIKKVLKELDKEPSVGFYFDTSHHFVF